MTGRDGRRKPVFGGSRALLEAADACIQVMSLTDHHDWIKSAATKLVLPGETLWQAMCAEWANVICLPLPFQIKGAEVAKTIEQNFIDWESSAFGFGYGTGEEHTLAALKGFMAAVGRDDAAHGYDYKKLEAALGPAVAWLLINRLCHYDINVIEYGTSPRFGWLTKEGEALKAFVDSKSVDELVKLCCDHDEDYIVCYPDACNCGPNGYEKGRICENTFWHRRK